LLLTSFFPLDVFLYLLVCEYDDYLKAAHRATKSVLLAPIKSADAEAPSILTLSGFKEAIGRTVSGYSDEQIMQLYHEALERTGSGQKFILFVPPCFFLQPVPCSSPPRNDVS
jgi:hypothetical protein